MYLENEVQCGFMSPDFLWNNSERPRTVPHINCANKLSGLRLLLLPSHLFLPATRCTLRAELPDRSASLPFAVAVRSPAKWHKPLWTSRNAGGRATRLTLLWTVVEQRLCLMNGDVLKCIVKYRLLSAMLHTKSTCNVYFFLGDIGEQEEWRFLC